MPLSADDYGALVQDIRNLLNQYRLFDVAESALVRSQRANNPKAAALEFFRGVRDGAVARSHRTYERALQLAREYIHTEAGTPVDDILVAPTDTERALFRLQTFSLRHTPDLSELVQVLNEVISALEADDVER
jgi:hypothetical protein